MLKPNTKKSFSEALSAWFSSFSDSFNAVKVGKIVGVDTSNQTVDVQVLHKRIDENNFFKKELREYPVLQGVPFVVLGGGTSSITFPISVGDNCLLLFCDYEIDRWWDSGEAQPSNYQRRHDISDAFALIGVHSMVDLLQGYSQYVQLKYNDSSTITVGESIDITNKTTNISEDANIGKDLTVGKDVTVTGNVTANLLITGQLHSTLGATGSFSTSDNKTVTVVDGIITSIS